ncbi:MAG: DUF1905 domain-containing protein [Patescibacteria group bacterium]
MERTYRFKALVWIFPGNAPWHMVTLPKKTAKDIDYYFAHVKRGWGSLPVLVTLGNTSWKTSIFTDKKSDSYILPLKLEVRKKEAIKVGDNVSFSLIINAW